MKKKAIGLLAAAVLSLSTSLSGYAMPAADDTNDYSEEYQYMQSLGEESTKRWTYASEIYTDLFIDKDGTAIYNYDIQGYQDKVDSIYVYTYFQKLVDGKWTRIGDHYLDFDTECYLLEERTRTGLAKGYDYRVYFSVYLFEGTEYENISVYTPVVHY